MGIETVNLATVDEVCDLDTYAVIATVEIGRLVLACVFADDIERADSRVLLDGREYLVYSGSQYFPPT